MTEPIDRMPAEELREELRRRDWAEMVRKNPRKALCPYAGDTWGCPTHGFDCPTPAEEK